MNIKNYTSTVDASRSMGKIEELLVEIGATNINKQYTDKACTGITFLLFDQQFHIAKWRFVIKKSIETIESPLKQKKKQKAL